VHQYTAFELGQCYLCFNDGIRLEGKALDTGISGLRIFKLSLMLHCCFSLIGELTDGDAGSSYNACDQVE